MDEPGSERREASAEEEAAEESQGFTVTDRRHWNLSEPEMGDEKQPSAPSYVEQLEAQLKKKDEQLREYIAAYKKEIVEGAEQTKQRLAREAEQQIKRAKAELAQPMIDVLETLERSIAAAEAQPAFDTLLEGIKRVQMLMLQKLAEAGLQRIESTGQPFDPQQHEAVAVAEVSEAEKDNVVMAELSPGFSFDGQVFRAARVQVGKFANTP